MSKKNNDSHGKEFTKGLAEGAGKAVGGLVVCAVVGFIVAGPPGAATAVSIGASVGAVV